MKYYKKTWPRNPVVLRDGRSMKFALVDNRLGIHKTENEDEIQSIAELMAKHSGGISEITETEFGELEKKSGDSENLKPSWREEISNAHLGNTLSPSEVVAAAKPKPPEQVVPTVGAVEESLLRPSARQAS